MAEPKVSGGQERRLEIEGRSYGGGVHELEPNEAEKLLTPKALRGAMPLDEVDRLVRGGRLAQVLEENDRLVLTHGLGLSKRECGRLRLVGSRPRSLLCRGLACRLC